MLTSIEGVYRDGLIELREKPSGMDGVRVIVTFIPAVKSASPGGDWPEGFFEKFAGAFSDAPIERGAQGEYELRETLR